MDLTHSIIEGQQTSAYQSIPAFENTVEINHRIANSLQLVSSFISMQERDVTDPAAKRALRAAASRVAAVGRIQRALLRSNNASVDIAPFLRSLCGDIEVSTGLKIQVEADDILLGADEAQYVAIVVNELLMNAAKHGYGEAGGEAKVTCARSGCRGMILSVADGGRGLPDGFDGDAADSVGMTVLRSAARQLGGKLTFEPASGAKATLQF